MKIRTVHDMILIGLLAIGLVGGFLYFQGPTEAYANLLTNGDMETASGGDPGSWTKYTQGNGAGTRDTTTYRQGSASAKETWSGAVGADTGVYYYQSFSASVGQVYVASVEIRSLSSDPLAGGAEAFLKLEFKNSGGTVINSYESSHLATSNTAWERHTVVGIAPAGTATVQINLVTWTAVASASGSAYFDDADLHLGTTATLFTDANSVYNESFETSDGGAPARPRGWGATETGGGTVRYSSTFANKGTYSAEIGAGATSGDNGISFLSFPVQWGQVVTVTCWVRTTATWDTETDAYLKLDWYRYDNNTAAGEWTSESSPGNVKFSSRIATATTSWTQLTVTGAAPSDSTTANQTFFGRINLIVNNIRGAGTASTYAYFDDIEVKVTGGFGQKTVANIPNIVADGGLQRLQLTFDEGWGGNISSYYDNSVGNGTYHMISDYYDMHDLFDINYQRTGGAWLAPAKNPYGSLTVIEQSPARTVMQAYAAGREADKTPASSGTDDYWTITYTVYPDGRIFVTEKVVVGDTAFTANVGGPFWAITEEYSSASTTFIEDDTDRAGAMLGDANLHDSAMWLYETGSPDIDSGPGLPIKSANNSGEDRSYVELTGEDAQFTASTTHTHHWMLDLSEATQSQTILDNKGRDYKTHTAGTYSLNFTNGVGSLLNSTNSINTDVDQDGFDEGAGCWNIQASSNGLRFILQADATYVRYKPAFFITGYTDTQLPASIEMRSTSDTTSSTPESTVKEQGTDYNIAFVPFSRVYKRYNSAALFSTIYADGYNNKTGTIAVSSPDNPVDLVKTDDYASWLVNTDVLAASGVLDLWGFDLGSRRDIDAATVNVTYYSASASSSPADPNNIYAFVSDFDQDGTWGESSPDEIIVSTANAAAADQTGSQAIASANLTDTLLRKLEVRAYTDLVMSNGDVTYQTAGTATSGLGNLTVPYPSSGVAANDLVLMQVSIRNTTSTPTTPSGFTALYGPDSTGTGRQWIYYKVADGTENGTNVSLTTNSTNANMARIYIFRNATPSLIEGGGFETATSTTVSDVSVTTTDVSRLAVAFVFVNDDSALGSFTGETGGDWTEAVADPTVSPVIATSNTTNGTTLAGGVSLNMPSGIAAGDLLIAFASNDNTGGTAMGISGWTQLFFTQYASNVVSHGAWAKIAVGSDTATLTGASQDYAAIVIRITGHAVATISTDIKVGTTASTSTANPDPPSLNAGSSENWLWLESFGADDDDDTATYWSTNYTGVAQVQSANTTTSTLCALAYRQNAVQTEDPGTMTMAASEEALAQTIAIPPLSGNIQLQTATMASAGIINGGSYTIASNPWGNRSFALQRGFDKTCYLKNAYISGTYYADDITDTAAAFNTNTEVFSAQNDYLYIGSAYKFNGILVDISSAASATINPTWEYYDSGTGWTSLTVTDNTSGFTKDGMVTFTAPANWTTWNKHDATRYIGGDYYAESLYYVRIKRQAASITAPQIRGLATNNLIFQYMSDLNTLTEFAMVAATLVDLLEFDAIGYFGKVKLSWMTGSELNNTGFNILRSEDAKNYVKVNKEIIPGLGTNIMGREYLYEDIDVVNGKTYYYLLEDVESGGKITKHGPVTARPGRDSDTDGMTDDWEYHYGLPATVADANVDSDDDGLTNIEEFSAGTDPMVIDSQDVIGASETGVKVIESAGLRTVLELDTTTLKVTNKNVDGVIYHVITLPEYTHGQTTDVGKPQIPTKGVLLGTLSKKPVTINILESEKETYPGYNIYPVPKAVLVEDPNDPAIKRLTYEFYKDTNAYAIDAFYPGKLAEVDYSNYLQDQQVIKVIFYPIQFNPVKGSLELYKKIKLEVLQEGADLGAASSAVAPKTALPLTVDNAYKIYITEDGIYRFTRPYLESAGISLAGINPTKLKIYNQGVEIPIYIYGEEDGIFDSSDYIEFYAKAMDTRYTGTNVYWLVLSDGAGLRMAASGQVEDAATTPGGFLEMYKGEDNTLYWMEAIGQDHWFIDSIYGSQVYNFTLNLDGVANTADEAAVKIALEGSVYSGAAFTHHLYARLNGYPIADVSWQGANENIIEAKFSQTYLTEGANTVTLEVGEDPTGYEEILVNWVEVSYLRNFTAKDNALAFGNYTGGAYQYRIGGFTGQDIEIYDITDPKVVQRITQFTVLPEGAAFAASFKDIGSKEYIVLTQDKAKIPSGVVRDEPSSLADKHNRADYIIITHPDFYDTVLPFADYRSKQGLKVKVVKLDDIYDEFNYGIADVNAVKDFLKYAYSNWTGPRPAYVLLVGDATYDYRDYSGYGFTNYVPAYLVHSLTFGETGSDNWFVCFDGDSDVIPDMLIGRFPVKTTDELKSIIGKVITYEAVSPDETWTKKMLLVADNDEKIFADTSEELASYLTKGYTADKQYFGTTTNNPAALKQNIINSINEGRLFVNYTGHGGIGLWANERLFTWDDISSLYNRNALPVFTTLTCADGYFVYPRYVESLGERLVNDANGGAIAAFVPSGISYPTTQAYLAEGFYGAYFKDRDAILGSMVARGKLSVYENESGGDAINVIQTFNLFGDPALRVRMKAPQIPAVAAPEVFDLDKGKVNEIFRLTEEPKAAESAESSTVIVDKVKDTKKGLTKIILAEEAAPASPSPAKGSLEGKVPAEKVLSTEGIQLEDKTASLAPPKWRVLSRADSGAKPLVKIDYVAIEKSVTRINEDAGQLAELEAKFDEAIKAADLQKATSILRVIAKLARKIYWRTF